MSDHISLRYRTAKVPCEDVANTCDGVAPPSRRSWLLLSPYCARLIFSLKKWLYHIQSMRTHHGLYNYSFYQTALTWEITLPGVTTCCVTTAWRGRGGGWGLSVDTHMVTRSYTYTQSCSNCLQHWNTVGLHIANVFKCLQGIINAFHHQDWIWFGWVCRSSRHYRSL